VPKAADLRSAILSLLGALTALVALVAGIAALLNFQKTRRQNIASLEVARRSGLGTPFESDGHAGASAVGHDQAAAVVNRTGQFRWSEDDSDEAEVA